MQASYELSEIEQQIMELFWKEDGAFAFSEIMKYCNEELQLGWAQGTLQTYLYRLISKGVLKTNNKRYRKLYSAQISKKELSHKKAENFLKTAYQGSLKNFLAAFTEGSPLTKQEVDELVAILRSNISE